MDEAILNLGESVDHLMKMNMKLPSLPHGLVVFAHGSGSSRQSPRADDRSVRASTSTASAVPASSNDDGSDGAVRVWKRRS